MKKKKDYKKIKSSKMTKNQDLANAVNKNKELLLAFDGKNLIPSTMVDRTSDYSRIETGYLFTPNIKMEKVQQFHNRTSTQFKDQASVFLRVRYHNPKNLTFQHLPVKDDVILDRKRYADVNRLQNGCITQVLPNVDVDENVKMGRKICNKEKFKVSPFRNVIEQLFKLKMKYKEEGKDLTEDFMKKNMHSINRQSIRKDVSEQYIIGPGKRLVKNNDERMLNMSPNQMVNMLSNLNQTPEFITKMKFKRIRHLI